MQAALLGDGRGTGSGGSPATPAVLVNAPPPLPFLKILYLAMDPTIRIGTSVEAFAQVQPGSWVLHPGHTTVGRSSGEGWVLEFLVPK